AASRNAGRGDRALSSWSIHAGSVRFVPLRLRLLRLRLLQDHVERVAQIASVVEGDVDHVALGRRAARRAELDEDVVVAALARLAQADEAGLGFEGADVN